MLSRSDLNLNRAEDAVVAQLLRGCCAFGSVAFIENASFSAERLEIESGYDDCLPVMGGGCWRDPASPRGTETLK